MYVHVVRHGGGRPVAWQDVTPKLGALPLPRPAGQVFETREELRTFFARVLPGRAPRRLPIDFRRREALLLSPGPRSSTGYDVVVERVREERGRIVVRVRERTPTLGERVAPRVTHPYRLITLPRSRKPVYIVWEGRA